MSYSPKIEEALGVLGKRGFLDDNEQGFGLVLALIDQLMVDCFRWPIGPFGMAKGATSGWKKAK